jgi:hypothetical protein
MVGRREAGRAAGLLLAIFREWEKRKGCWPKAGNFQNKK